MTDFAFKIEGDASAANRAADTVLDRLEDIRRKAADASKGMSFDKLTGSFAQLGNAIRQEHQAMQRAAQIHDDLARKNQPLVQSFGGLAEAIRREQEMLERIEGPTKRRIQDLQTLDSLLKRGAITQTQHAAEVGKLSPSSGGMLGSLRGGLAMAGVGVGASQIGGMLDEFQNLQNRLRYLAGGDMEKVNQLFTQLQGIANRTRQDLGATTETFVKVSKATERMGLSTSQTMSFMERLNKAVALSGASSSAAAAGMLQLSQGLSAGALRGEEFNSVVEQIPVVADTIEKSLGITRAELRQMAHDGKLTAEIVVEAFRKAGTSLDKDFANTVPTVGQSLTVLKNQAMVAIGQLDAGFGVSKRLGEALRTVGGVVGSVGSAIGTASEYLGKFRDAFEYVNPLTQVKKLGDLVGAWDSVTGSVVHAMEVEDRYAKRRYEYVLAIAQGADAVNKWHIEQTELNLRLTLGDAAADAFRRSVEKLNAETAQGSLNLAAMGKATTEFIAKLSANPIEALARLQDPWFASPLTPPKIEKVNKQLKEYEEIARRIGLISTPAPKITQKEQFEMYQKDLERMVQEEIEAENRAAKYAQESVEAKIKAEQEWRDAVLKATDEAAQKRMDLVKKEQEAAKQIRDAWAQGLGSIAADFVNMAAQGEFSFERLGSSLAKLALQIAAMQIGGPWGAFLGSFAGGLSMPGHATGTQFMVGGRGGSDQNIVAFRASGNERVTVETPDDVRTGRYLGGGRQVTQIVVQNDAREVVSAFGTRAGERQYARLNRKFRRS